MEFRRIWVLRGGNYWTRFPALEIEVLLQEDEARLTSEIPHYVERLLELFAALEPADSPNRHADPFFQRLASGTSLADVLRQVTLLLQLRAGSEVAFGLARPAEPPTFYRVVVEYEEEELARECLRHATQITLAPLTGATLDIRAIVRQLCELAHDVRLGPSTGAIVRAARDRGIPVRRLNEGSLVQLGHGIHQRRIMTAETDSTGAIAEDIAQDKDLTRQILSLAGVPVPEGSPVDSPEECWAVAQEIGLPVVVKPQFGNHGRGVATNLTTFEQVSRAFVAARQEGQQVIVETFIPGFDHRLLVIGNRLVAAARRDPAQVVGDGVSTIRQLIDEVNKDPARSDGHSTILSYIKIDAVAMGVLSEQGHTPDSVPTAGERVLIRRNGNLSTGGTATDVTDWVHPEIAQKAIDAARAVGLDIAGVDLMAVDISQPITPQRAAVVEVNAGPGLRMHLQPSSGKPRAVGDAIVEMLFPPGKNGRIPIVAVTGVNGKTTTTRLIAHIILGTGKTVGMTCTDGAYIFQPGQPLRRTNSRDCSGPQSAVNVLLNPAVQAAVLETARGGILREGLGFDRCDVGVVTNVGGGDHFGLRGIETLDELARVKRVVVEAVAPTGSAVLNAADPLVAAMAEHCSGRVVLFSGKPDCQILAQHRKQGGRAVLVQAGTIVLAEGEWEEPLMNLADVPLTHHGKVSFEVENALAAAGAAWGLGLAVSEIRSGLGSFVADDQHLPGRFNVYHSNGATVVVDYAHNPSALAALIDSLDAFSAQRRSIVFCSSNRRDTDVIEMGKQLGDAFDRVILYQDHGNSDRTDGELNGLLRRGLEQGLRRTEITEWPREPDAIAAAFAELRSGDLLVVGVEAIDQAVGWVRSHLTS